MIEKHKELLSALGGVLILLLLVLTASTAVGVWNKIKEGRYIGQEVEAKNTISVSGQGEIYADPDLAMVNFSVVTEKDSVEESLKENKSKMNKVIEKLKAEGVEKKDLKTTTFNIQPRYEWHEKNTKHKEGERVLMGYKVTQELKVKIRNLDQVGEIIQEATDAGANRVGNIRFTIENEDKLHKKAKKKAIEEAKNKAKETASQLGVRLMEIVDYSEKNYNPRPYSDTMLKGAEGGSTPQIEPGQNKVEVNVSITYEIN